MEDRKWDDKGLGIRNFQAKDGKQESEICMQFQLRILQIRSLFTSTH